MGKSLNQANDEAAMRKLGVESLTETVTATRPNEEEMKLCSPDARSHVCCELYVLLLLLKMYTSPVAFNREVFIVAARSAVECLF